MSRGSHQPCLDREGTYRDCGQPTHATREDGSVIRLANQRVIDYCNNYFAQGGESLVSGWGQRAYEWQFGLGVQHELLPRLSMEVTYNRRWGGNRVLADSINVTPLAAGAAYVPNGCDLYSTVAGGTTDADACMTDLLNSYSPTYDFYGIEAPVDTVVPVARPPSRGGPSTTSPPRATCGSRRPSTFKPLRSLTGEEGRVLSSPPTTYCSMARHAAEGPGPADPVNRRAGEEASDG